MRSKHLGTFAYLTLEKAADEKLLRGLESAVSTVKARLAGFDARIHDAAADACCIAALTAPDNCEHCPNERRGVEYDFELGHWGNRNPRWAYVSGSNHEGSQVTL